MDPDSEPAPVSQSVFLRGLHHKMQAFILCWSVKKSLEYRSELSKGRSRENEECEERESREKCASFKINRFLHSVAGGLLKGTGRRIYLSVLRTNLLTPISAWMNPYPHLKISPSTLFRQQCSLKELDYPNIQILICFYPSAWHHWTGITVSTLSQITAEQIPAMRDGERLFLPRCLHYSYKKLHAGQ